MRFMIWLVVLSITAVSAAWVMNNNAGHLTIFWNIHRIDLSLNMALLLLLASNVFLFFFLRLLSELINLPVKAKVYRQRQRGLKASHDLVQSINHLFAGRFSKASKLATSATLYEETANVAQMIISQSNHYMKNFSVRDEALSKIQSPEFLQAKLILQAQNSVENRDPSNALEVIKQLQEKGARQILVQAIAMRAHQLAKNWSDVIRLANILKKRNYLSPLMAQARMVEAMSQWLLSNQCTSSELLKQWQELSSDDQRSPVWMKLFIKGFIQVGDSIQAKKLIDAGLAPIVHPEILTTLPSYVKLPGVLITEPTSLVERLQAQDPANPHIQFTLGELCFIQKLWGKAISCYEAVIASPQSPIENKIQVHFRLIEIFEEIQNLEQSQSHQKSLLQLLKSKWIIE